MVNRWMNVELRQLTCICPELDHGNVCPACPMVNNPKSRPVDYLGVLNGQLELSRMKHSTSAGVCLKLYMYISDIWYYSTLGGCIVWLAEGKICWE